MDPTKEQRHILCRSPKKCAETLEMIRQAFGEESMGRTRVFEWHALFRVYQKTRDRWREKSRTCSLFSLTSRGLFTKNSSWQAKKYIPHTTVRFYGDCVKMCIDFAPNFGDWKTDCCVTTTHNLTPSLSCRNFWPKQKWLLSPTHPTFLCFPDWR
jgi:hypothetical protein